MREQELKKFYIEFVGSLQVRWGIELDALDAKEAEADARRSLPESSNDWTLGDGTNPVIDVEMTGCTELATEVKDRDLGRLELENKYQGDHAQGWGHHPVHSRTIWRNAVADNDTVSGYWDWVYQMLQNEDE